MTALCYKRDGVIHDGFTPIYQNDVKALPSGSILVLSYFDGELEYVWLCESMAVVEEIKKMDAEEWGADRFEYLIATTV